MDLDYKSRIKIRALLKERQNLQQSLHTVNATLASYIMAGMDAEQIAELNDQIIEEFSKNHPQ